MLNLLTWNIRQGGGSRISKIKQAIREMPAHIIALNEWRNNRAGVEIRSELLRLGFLHQHTSSAQGKLNTVFLASRFSFESRVYTDADERFPHNIISGSFEAFDVYSVYFPHKKKHRLLDFVREEIIRSARPAIVLGDFNTGHNFIDQQGNSFWYEDELLHLEASGMIDAFRLIHGQKKAYSWYSHQLNGFRYDHIYVSDVLKPLVKDCYYRQEYREAGISDHAPMLLRLDVN